MTQDRSEGVAGAPRGELVPVGQPESMEEWAELLVARAREEGVALTGQGGLLTGLMRQVLQTGLEVEMAEHLGYGPHERTGWGSGNSRNGAYDKTVATEIGEVELRVPRDRQGTFEPVTVPKYQRRLDGLSGNVISLYAKGLTTGDIQQHLLEIEPVRGVRRRVGAALSCHDPGMAVGLAGVRALPRVPRRAQEGRLHHQRDRVAQRPLPPRRPSPRPLPQRTGSPQGALPRRHTAAQEPLRPNRQDERLENDPQHPDRPLRRPNHGQHDQLKSMTATAIYTKNPTVPDPVNEYDLSGECGPCALAAPALAVPGVGEVVAVGLVVAGTAYLGAH